MKQGADALPDRCLLDPMGIGAFEHFGADRIAHRQGFDDGGSALVAALAFGAADRSVPGSHVITQAKLLASIRGRRIGLSTVHAELSDQALADDQMQRRCEQIIIDAHVQQARDRGRRGVGVQRREQQMAGQRCLNGDVLNAETV